MKHLRGGGESSGKTIGDRRSRTGSAFNLVAFGIRTYIAGTNASELRGHGTVTCRGVVSRSPSLGELREGPKSRGWHLDFGILATIMVALGGGL
jgi:hypothetical protein